MRSSLQLFNKIVLFTRPNCGLCDNAKRTIQSLQKQVPFDYSEVDITNTDNKQWKDLYDFDVPVVHVWGAQHNGDYIKFMHRIDGEKVLEVFNNK